MPAPIRPQRPGYVDPNDPRLKRLPLTPEEDPYGGILPNFELELPEPVSPIPTPALTQPEMPAVLQTGAELPIEKWQTPPANLTALRAWYSGAAKVPGAPPMPEWGKRTPTYSRLHPPPPKVQPALQPGVQRTVSGVPVGPKGFTPTMPTAPTQGFQVRPGAMPSLSVQPPMPTADRQRFTLADAERRAMQQEFAGQGAGQYLQEAGMAPFVKQPRGLVDLAKEAFIRQAGGAAGLATGGVQRTPGETLRDQYLAIKAGIPQAGATALNFMDVLGRSATAGAPVGQPGATYSPSPATVTPSPVFGYTARGLQQASQDILGQRSPAIQRREQQAEAELAQSQDSALEQVARFALQVYKDPAQAEKHILTNLPMMAPGLAAGKVVQTAARVSKLASAADAAGLGMDIGAVVGAAMTGGDAQSTAYENIKQALIAQGMSEQEADQQAFRKSLLSFGLGTGLGVVSARTGIESGAFRNTSSQLARPVKRALTEIGTEQLEELVPLITSNVQAGKPAMQNVGQTAGATLLATAPFAGIAAIGRPDGGTNKVPDALQTETGSTVQPPTGQFGGVIPPSAARQAYETWTRAGGPRAPEAYQVLRKSRSLPGPLGLPPVGLSPVGLPSIGMPDGQVPQRPATPLEPTPLATAEQVEGAGFISPDAVFRPFTTTGRPEARPIGYTERPFLQDVLRRTGEDVYLDLEDELPELQAEFEAGQFRRGGRRIQEAPTLETAPSLDPAAGYTIQAMHESPNQVLNRMAAAYKVDPQLATKGGRTKRGNLYPYVFDRIVSEMQEIVPGVTKAEVQMSAQALKKGAERIKPEIAKIWDSWYERFGQEKGLTPNDVQAMKMLVRGRQGLFFRPDVQVSLGVDPDDNEANKLTQEAISEDMAKLLQVPISRINLTRIPPNAWRNWASLRGFYNEKRYPGFIAELEDILSGRPVDIPSDLGIVKEAPPTTPPASPTVSTPPPTKPAAPAAPTKPARPVSTVVPPAPAAPTQPTVTETKPAKKSRVITEQMLAHERYEEMRDKGLPPAPLSYKPMSYTATQAAIERAKAEREESQQRLRDLQSRSPFKGSKRAEEERIERAIKGRRQEPPAAPESVTPKPTPPAPPAPAGKEQQITTFVPQRVTRTGRPIDPNLTNTIGFFIGLLPGRNPMKLEPGYAYRTVSAREVDSIAREGFMITDPALIGQRKRARAQTTKKMFSKFNPDRPNSGYATGSIILRVPESKVPVNVTGQAVAERDVEVLTYDGEKWVAQTPAEFVRNQQAPPPAAPSAPSAPSRFTPPAPPAPAGEAVTPPPVRRKAAPAPAPKPAPAQPINDRTLTDRGWSRRDASNFTGPNGEKLQHDPERKVQRWVYTDRSGNTQSFDSAREAIKAIISEPEVAPPSRVEPTVTEPRKKKKVTEALIKPVTEKTLIDNGWVKRDDDEYTGPNGERLQGDPDAWLRGGKPWTYTDASGNTQTFDSSDEAFRAAVSPSVSRTTQAKEKAAPATTAPEVPTEVRQIFDTLDSPGGKKTKIRNMIKSQYPETGKKAVFVNDNIEQIIAEAEANGKVTKECP